MKKKNPPIQAECFSWKITTCDESWFGFELMINCRTNYLTKNLKYQNQTGKWFDDM